MSAATPAAGSHLYLLKKSVEAPQSLFELPAEHVAEIIGYPPASKGEHLTGRLLAPVTVAGRLSTVELIDEHGRKSALAGGPKKGGYWSGFVPTFRL